MSESPRTVGEHFAAPPDPGQADTLDALVERLRLLKVWAGDPSYEQITQRINRARRMSGRVEADLAAKTTVVDCFRLGRRRLNTELVVAVVEALHPEVGYVTQWHQALRVIGAEIHAASQVRVQNTLPQSLAGFTGRSHELGQLLDAWRHRSPPSEAVVISAVEGMAGVGKTQLAVQAAHTLMEQKAFDRVLFVDLRGFNPDRTQPPADPAAVLDGFLRLLGVAGQQIPHRMAARVAAYRTRLAATRTLVVLDNAASAEQVQPLLPATAGCMALITSRRNLSGLTQAIRLAVDTFSVDEAVQFLTRSLLQIPIGSDPEAARRIAERCGNLPLALSLVAGHILTTEGWTLTDHADRLDERHRHRQLDSGVQLALTLSYQHLPVDQQRLLRLAALHPGQDVDVHAAAALLGSELEAAQTCLDGLVRDHLLQQAIRGRYSMHDLVRAYAGAKASDHDSPPQRRTALDRLLAYYLATTAHAVDVCCPHERHRRPAPPQAATPTPDLPGQRQADQWLETEFANVLAVARYAGENGWPQVTWQLATVLDRPLCIRGRYRDAEALHRQALDLAISLGNPPAEMKSMNGLGYIHWVLGDCDEAADRHRRALRTARQIGDRLGEVDALNGLGDVQATLGNYHRAGNFHQRALQIAQEIADGIGERVARICLASIQLRLGNSRQADNHLQRAWHIAQETGDRAGELKALHGLGDVHRAVNEYEQAINRYERALHIAQESGDRAGEVNALIGLGHVHFVQQHYEVADTHFLTALPIAGEIGYRIGELSALTSLASVQRMLGRHQEATYHSTRALELADELSSANWQFEALQSLGRLQLATGNPHDALAYHERALKYACHLAQPTDQARAHDGLAHAYHALGRPAPAADHWQRALDILIDLGLDYTDEAETSVAHIRAHLGKVFADKKP